MKLHSLWRVDSKANRAMVFSCCWGRGGRASFIFSSFLFIIMVVTMPFFRQFSSGPVIMPFWGRRHTFAISKADVVHGELFYSIEAKTWFISLLIYIFWSKLKKEMIQSFIWIESFCLFFAWWGWRWARRKQEELDKHSPRWGKQNKTSTHLNSWIILP